MIKRRLCIITALIVAVTSPVLCFAANVSTPGVTSEVYDIPSGEFIADNLDDLKMLVDNSENLDFVENSVLTVVVPSNLDFSIDPLELAGRGQIYSNGFLIQNYSDTDVTVKLEDVKYTFANETDFVSLAAPPVTPFGIGNPSRLKEVYMLLHYENRTLDDFVITDTARSETSEIALAAAEYDSEGNFVALSQESSLIFTFTGIVNHMPAMKWEDKDFTVSITYTIIYGGTDEESDAELAEDEESVSESEEKDTDTDVSEAEDSIIEPEMDSQPVQKSEDNSKPDESEDMETEEEPQSEASSEESEPETESPPPESQDSKADT